jgi:hypothetical protein
MFCDDYDGAFVAQSGNGIDLAAVYKLLREVADRVISHDRRFDQTDRKLGEVTADIAGLREAVTNYHATVLGHGILISELDERLRRIERWLKTEPTGE